LPADIKTRTRSPLRSNTVIFRNVLMLSMPALVRESAKKTMPSSSNVATQYVTLNSSSQLAIATGTHPVPARALLLLLLLLCRCRDEYGDMHRLVPAALTHSAQGGRVQIVAPDGEPAMPVAGNLPMRGVDR